MAFSDLEVIIDEWRGRWLAQRLKHSQHPVEFWKEIVSAILEGRQALRNNPLVPVGRFALTWPGALEMLVERNNRGILFEQNGNVEAAMVVYEVSIGDEFIGTHPYDRLRIHYTQQRWYRDALRVCEAYAAQPKPPSVDSLKHFRHHGQKLAEKLKRQSQAVDDPMEAQ
jgi:hypothetical protein